MARFVGHLKLIGQVSGSLGNCGKIVGLQRKPAGSVAILKVRVLRGGSWPGDHAVVSPKGRPIDREVLLRMVLNVMTV